ncbi:MAG: TIGR01212 family radical SAM protein, partial [Oscillospiraceae bacterium]|nr:TIGR01212 family radical SAM protein [Oscillospiraceae bacterium]
RVTHVILGLPGETRDDMLDTVHYVREYTDGIKLQLLHVLRGTKLADMYAAGDVRVLEPQEYYDIVADALEILGEDIVIHRLTGDGAKKDLIAPLWSADKKRVLADMNRTLRARDIYPAEI